MSSSAHISAHAKEVVRLFLCGDVMTGRGIDQILSQPCEPTLYEPHVKDARDYWRLAEAAHGAVRRPVDDRYIWGDAHEAWDRMRPDLRIVNLETAVTTSEAAWPQKGIHYRMSPKNVGCLTAARIDCCALANNHVLDWGQAGLNETLNSLHRAGIQTCGAGENCAAAEAPAVLRARDRQRVLVFSFGVETSGIPSTWAAGEENPGVNWLPDLSEPSVERAAAIVQRHRQDGDLVIVSIHWGGNWGYDIQPGEQFFARQLIDRAGADLIHGHSSHHAKGIEVYRDRLTLYGCGDFLTDYEGILGYQRFRGDLSLMYFADMTQSSGCLARLQMIPFQMRQLQLRRASDADTLWLSQMLTREGQPFGSRAIPTAADSLSLQWERITSKERSDGAPFAEPSGKEVKAMFRQAFRNRVDAADQLADKLQKIELHQPLVLGIPRGGVITAARLGHKLNAEVDVALARKLRHPLQPELAIGAIAEDGQTYLHRDAAEGVDEGYLNQEKQQRLAELRERRKMFSQIRPPASVEGRTVIVTDDGIATGSTMFAALRALKAQHPRELIVAVPVAPPTTVQRLQSECDRVVSLIAPEAFFAIGEYYEDFRPVEDQEACAALREAGLATHGD